MYADRSPQLVVRIDLAQVAAQVAEDACLVAANRPADLHIAVSGGSVGQVVMPIVLRQLAAQWQATDQTAHYHLWYADERHLPADHPERNHQAILTALPPGRPGLDHPFIVHPAPDADLLLIKAADQYNAALARTVPAGSTGLPRLDLILLGMGEDGHTASLFPGQPLDATGPVVAVRNSPKPPPQRLSLSLATINQADHVWVIASGAPKAGTVTNALAPPAGQARPPVALVGGTNSTRWYLDQAAAQGLPTPDRPEPLAT